MSIPAIHTIRKCRGHSGRGYRGGPVNHCKLHIVEPHFTEAAHIEAYRSSHIMFGIGAIQLQFTVHIDADAGAVDQDTKVVFRIWLQIHGWNILGLQHRPCRAVENPL
ncbi:hypothetical protein D3C81_1881200 [compost metagenome]